MKILLIILIMLNTARASETIKFGTFSLATEAGWGAGFRLEKNGSAVITPSFDGEDEEGASVPPPKEKNLTGTWKQTNDSLEISYSKFKDLFKFEKECEGWKDYPCFRYDKSLVKIDGKSPLNFDYPYINWDWKNAGQHAVSQKCLDDCAEMIRKGELKKGVDLNACAKTMCK